jgi:drug/metabolite transporter (DMT)-like permease
MAVIGVGTGLPMAAATADVAYRGHLVPWWLPVVALGLITAAFAYLTGIAGVRLLGARISSFVGLLEVLAAVLFAWLLLAQLPTGLQLSGGALVLVGVAVVKMGEPESPNDA